MNIQETVSESPTDLRIVLLGRSFSWKNAVGNIILRNHSFHHDSDPNQYVKVSHPVEGRLITVINTPDLFVISHDKLSEDMCLIKSLPEPGPHVFLLVLQPEIFTEEERNRIKNVLDKLNDQSFDHSMVLTTDGDKRGHLHENQALNLMIKECRGRQCLINLSDRNHLMTCVDQLVEDNRGGYVSCEIFEDTTSSTIQENTEVHNGKDILEKRENKKTNSEKVKQPGLASFEEQSRPGTSEEQSRRDKEC
uniref:AIG1-type G domain-containing protein n=1 Tax=Esox lucius TaxID=8010 RepID=A0A3P9A529_ESOLU